MSKELFERVTAPSLLSSQRVGNLATGSLWGCLISLLTSSEFKRGGGGGEGKRILMFSYGSGASASLFSFISYGNGEEGEREVEERFPPFIERLDRRKKLSPASFFCVLDGMENGEGPAGGLPVEGPEEGFIEQGDWFLKEVDDKKRRTYEQFMG